MSVINKIQDLESKLPSILGSLPNVISWGIGKKIRKGEIDRATLCITVTVSKKEDLPIEQQVPKFIAGVPTDVVVMTDAEFNVITPGYSKCTACFTTPYSGGISYGINGCNTPNCSSTPNLTAATKQVCEGCNCLEQRQLDLSSTGANAGKTVVRGGKGAIYKINYTGSCSCSNGIAASGCNACTATLVAKDNEDGKLILLTNHHCLNVPNRPFANPDDLDISVPPKTSGDIYRFSELKPSIQSILNNGWTMPASVDAITGNQTNVIGKFKKGVWVTKQPNVQNKVDAIAIELNLPDVHSDYVIPLPGISQLGDGPFPWITKEQFDSLFELPQPLYVYKSSRTSGAITPIEETEIIAAYMTSAIADIGFQYIKAISAWNKIHFEGGDSGSPVLVNYNNSLHVLGIHFAGGVNQSDCGNSVNCPGCNLEACGRKVGFFIPIWEVAEKLQVSAWDGAVVVDSNLQNITINGLPYTRSTPTTLPITHKKD